MAAVSELEKDEPPEREEEDEPPELEKNDNAAAAVLPFSPDVPRPAAVAERYECREKLGPREPGQVVVFGDVYKAWDRVSEREVAVKRLSGRTDERFVAAPRPYFYREVMSLAACGRHPSVVQLLAAHADCSGADGDRFVVVTEYAGPMNLRTYIRRRLSNGEPFDEDEVRDVMEQLLSGAAHAHAAGVLHRDMVPENVVVDMDAASCRMVYKICGFGLSEPPAEDRDDFGPRASASSYRAPELFLGSKDYNNRVDTWSLGCIMAELITGDGVPFFGEPDDEVYNRMLHVVGSCGRGLSAWCRARRWLRKTERGNGNLKKMFPPELLSPAGFKVLKGLLHSNPDRRLSAAAALKKRWFRRGGGQPSEDGQPEEKVPAGDAVSGSLQSLEGAAAQQPEPQALGSSSALGSHGSSVVDCSVPVTP